MNRLTLFRSQGRLPMDFRCELYISAIFTFGFFGVWELKSGEKGIILLSFGLKIVYQWTFNPLTVINANMGSPSWTF